MDLREAEYILTIYRNNSISIAAKKLYISQPSLSRSLQKVETELGEPLFFRDSGKYRPTYLGEEYLAHAESLIAANQAWEMRLKEIQNNTVGNLTIALPQMRSLCILPQILEEFHEKYPNVYVETKEENYRISEEYIAKNNIDFAIFSTNQELSALTYRVLAEEALVLVAKSGHEVGKLANKSLSRPPYPFLSLDSILKYPLILPSTKQSTGIFLTNLFKNHKEKLISSFKTRSQETALSLAARGTGLCFVPESYALTFKKLYPLDIYSFEKQPTKTKLIAAYLPHKYMPAYGSFFLDLVEKQLDSLIKLS